tara:strand:- start:67 stop:306 length:240 start_codon:yes stop_codon:yes gene_type:complete
LSKKIKQRFPIGTLVKASVVQYDGPPLIVIGIVVGYISKSPYVIEVFLGANDWVAERAIFAMSVGKLKTIQRPYVKEKQ